MNEEDKKTIAENKSDVAEKTEKDVAELLQEAEQKRDEYLAGWQRAKADFINYKKDEHARLAEAVSHAAVNIISDILHVLDALDLGLASAGEKETKGLALIRSQLLDSLRRYGLERMLVKQGDDFNPAEHEAMMVEESEGPEDKVLEELVPGYRLRERVIRPAKVKVSKAINSK